MKRMKSIALVLSLFLITGCTGPEAKEIAQTEIISGPAMVLILMIVTIIFSWISGSEYLKMNRKMGLQFLIIFTVSLITSLLLSLDTSGVWENVLNAQFFSFFTIPFSFFFTALILAIVPNKYTFYTPSLVALIYQISAFTVFATNQELADLILSPFRAWIVVVIIFAISIACIIKRYRFQNSKKQ